MLGYFWYVTGPNFCHFCPFDGLDSLTSVGSDLKMWSTLKSILFATQSPRVAYCDDLSAEKTTTNIPSANDDADTAALDKNQNSVAQTSSTSQQSTASVTTKKVYKALPYPGTSAGLDGASMQILQVLFQQDHGCNIVVQKTLTPFLAVVHDFNIGVEKYIPSELRSSIYTFKTIYSNLAKTSIINAGVDWFGRLNAGYTRKFGKKVTTNLVGHISNSAQVNCGLYYVGFFFNFYVLFCRSSTRVSFLLMNLNRVKCLLSQRPSITKEQIFTLAVVSKVLLLDLIKTLS